MKRLTLIFTGWVFMTLQNEAYNWNATYHKQSDFQYEAGKKAIDGLLLKGTEHILDVGCGTGRITAYAAERLSSGTIIGIDLSRELIDFAQQEHASVPHVSFSQYDLLELPFEGEFDLAISFFCLQWIKDQEKALFNIVRSLKPGGKALCYISCKNELVSNWEKACNKIFEENLSLRECRSEHLYFQSVEQWLQWAHNIGATSIKYQLLDRTKVFNTQQEVVDFILALNIEPGMGEEQRKFFVEQAVKELYKLYGISGQQPFNYTTRALVLEFSA